MYKHAPTIIAFIGFGALVLGIACSSFIFPKLVEMAINANIALKEGTSAYSMWKKQPFPLKLKVYFFNVVNPDDVQNGAKPIVRENGPYVYDEYREKVDISVNEETDSIKYILKKTYFFNQQESACRTEDDIVTIIHPGIVGTALKVEAMMPAALSLVNDAVPFLFSGAKDIFLRGKVKDILFDGMLLSCEAKEVEFICGAMKAQLPKTMRQHPNGRDYLFSMFNYLNGTDDGPYEISRGLKNKTRGKILSFNGDTELSIWNGDSCNMINGTDSTVFNPVTPASKQERLYVFAADFCRSLYSEFERDSETFGIPTIRYSTTPDSLAINEQNNCFCDEDQNENGEIVPKCPPSGLLNLEPCVQAPVLVSYPHFYLADKELLNFVSGLNPRKELHQTFAELEPKTATPIIGKKRIQMNIQVKSLQGFDLMANLSAGVFPIVWVEEGAELPPKLVEMLKSEFSKMAILDIIKWILTVGGIILMLGSFILILYKENLLCFDKFNKNTLHIPKTDNVQIETIADSNIMLYPSLYPQANNRNVNDGHKRKHLGNSVAPLSVVNA